MSSFRDKYFPTQTKTPVPITLGQTIGSITLGKKYRDEITGFEGTATGVSVFLNGCIRAILEGKDSKGDPDGLTFDEQRLIEVDTGQKVEPKAPTGGPRPAIPRTGLR